MTEARARVTTPIHLTKFNPLHLSSRAALHSTFGGVITESDFSTDYRGSDSARSSIANRIATAWRFDYQCKRNAEIRERGKK